MQAAPTAPEVQEAPIAQPVPVVVRAAPIASAVAIFRGLAEETGTPSGVVPGDTTDPRRAATAAVALTVWDLAGAASIAGAEGSEAVALVVAAEGSGAAAEAVVVAAVAGERRGS